MNQRSRSLLLAVVATLVLALGSVAVPRVAHAFWTSAGQASGTAQVGRFPAPTSVTVPAVSYTAAVPVGWTAPNGGAVAPDGYYVERQGSRPGPACGTSPTVLVTTTSCLDTVAGDGSYTYRVVAVRASWTAAATSGTATVRLPVTTAFCQQPTTAAAGTVIAPAVRLCLRTAGGDAAPVNGYRLRLTLAGTSTGQLQGTTEVDTDATGTAVFDTLRIDQAGSDYRLAATGPGLTSTTSSQFAIVPATANILTIISPARTLAASTTSDGQSLTVRRTDPFGNPVTSGTTTVRLVSSSTGTTRFSTTPTGTAVTSVTIPAGSSTVVVYYADTRAGQPVVTASATGLVSGSQTQTVVPAAATTLAFSTAAPSFTVDAAARFGPLTVVRRDAYGNAAPLTTATAVTLSVSGSSTTVFAATSTGAPVTAVTMAAGQSAVDVWMGDIRPGRPVLTAAMAGLTSATQTATVVVGPAVTLAFTTTARSGTATSSATLGPLTVQQQDVYGNAVVAPSAGLVITLGSTSSGARFATRSAGTAVTTTTMTAGASSVSVYYGDTVAGTPTITATATGLTAAAQGAAIAAGTTRKLVFTNPAIAAAPTADRTLGPLTVQRQDAFNNPTTSGATVVTLTTGNTTTGSFAATSGGAATATITIPTGASTATAWYGDTRTGTIRLSALATNLTTATQNIVLTAVASRLVITTTAKSGAASSTATLGAITVSRQDQFGNAAPAPTGGTVLALSSSTAGTPVFATASGGAPVTQVTMAAGASTQSLYYGDTRVGTPVITIAATGVTPATQTQTITPGTTRALVLTSAPVGGAPSSAATLGPLTVARVDAFGNQVTNSTSSLTVSLTSTSTGRRFATTSGGTSVTSVRIAAGAATAPFYYGDTVAGTPTITVSASGLTSGTQTARIG